MQTFWYHLWGSGCGLIKRIAPQTRLFCGLVLFTSSMMTPVSSRLGILTVTLIVLFWIAVCRPPWGIVRIFSQLGLAMFLPYFLLVPLFSGKGTMNAEGWVNAISITGSVIFRGMAGLYITTTTVTAITMSDLRQGLLSLPVPNVVSAIVLQIVHQTTELVCETRRMVAAIVVRGATGGWITSLRVLIALPRVWIPRVIFRADRVAAAMEVRGFSDKAIQDFDRTTMTLRDGVTILLMILIFILASLLRIWE